MLVALSSESSLRLHAGCSVVLRCMLVAMLPERSLMVHAGCSVVGSSPETHAIYSVVKKLLLGACWLQCCWRLPFGCMLDAVLLKRPVWVQAYVHQLGIYLVEASETNNQQVCNQLDQLAVETGSLLICMALSNPKAFKAMQSTRLDKEHFEEVLQPDSFYTGMLVSALTASSRDSRSMRVECFQSVCRAINCVLTALRVCSCAHVGAHALVLC